MKSASRDSKSNSGYLSANTDGLGTMFTTKNAGKVSSETAIITISTFVSKLVSLHSETLTFKAKSRGLKPTEPLISASNTGIYLASQGLQSATAPTQQAESQTAEVQYINGVVESFLKKGVSFEYLVRHYRVSAFYHLM